MKKPTFEEVFERAKKKTFYPDCSKPEAWTEGYLQAMRDQQKANKP